MLKSDRNEGMHISEFKAIYFHVSIWNSILESTGLQYLHIADSGLQQVRPHIIQHLSQSPTKIF